MKTIKIKKPGGKQIVIKKPEEVKAPFGKPGKTKKYV